MDETGDSASDAKDKERDKQEREERLKSLRERLYSRGNPPSARERHTLPDTPQDVSRSWPAPRAQHSPIRRTKTLQSQVIPTAAESITKQGIPDDMAFRRRKRRPYRAKLIAVGLIFFAAAVILSGAFLFFGGNTISGNNITVGVSGPFAIGGGEELSLQVTIANQNAVPIESATLIIEYPLGTQSAEEPGKELFRDRKQLEKLNPGEIINVPIRAIVFGEENEEKNILVSVEYRVRGSNATFFKEAAPLRFKISSSPVVISIESLKRISSGQEIEFNLMVASNAPTPLSDLLIKAEYPSGFDFSESEPSPVSGRNIWTITELDAEESEEITLRGILVGKQDETRIFRFSVGVANERDQFDLASVFTTVSHEVVIEQPFLGIDVRINSSRSEDIVVAPGQTVQVVVSFENTLSGVIYDGEIEAELSGNALDESKVNAGTGFYNSSENKLVWDAVSVKSLDEILPGEVSTVSFSLTPREGGGASQTPQINMVINVRGKRVSESNVPQEIFGTASRSVKVESSTVLDSNALYSIGAFTNTGPIPPQAEEVTTYTILMTVVNGSNAITDAEVAATLPSYMTWLDLTTPGSEFSYNAVEREITWKAEDFRAGETKEASFQISLLPSLTQLGDTPTLIGEQRLKATDRFTGTTIRATTRALTTQLTEDPDEETHNGRILPKDDD